MEQYTAGRIFGQSTVGYEGRSADTGRMPLQRGSGGDELNTQTVAQRIALSILAALHDTSVLAFDRELRFVFGAGPALRGHGFDPADFGGRRCDQVLGRRWPLCQDAYRAALAGETTSIWLDDLDGNGRCLVEVAPLSSDQGSVCGGVAIARDVTELCPLERESRANESLQRAGFDDPLVAMATTDL